MMFIPLFPKLSPELALRVEEGLVRVRDKRISESAFVEFVSVMIGSIFEEIVESPRVKSSFEEMLPPLIGKRLCFHIEPLSPWTIEVAPVPQVLSFRLVTPEEARQLPGFAGDFDAMKMMLVGAADPSTSYRLVVERRVRVVNASPTNPATWIRSLFALTGPTLDRKDLVEDAIAKLAPTINSKLQELGC